MNIDLNENMIILCVENIEIENERGKEDVTTTKSKMITSVEMCDSKQSMLFPKYYNLLKMHIIQL